MRASFLCPGAGKEAELVLVTSDNSDHEIRVGSQCCEQSFRGINNERFREKGIVRSEMNRNLIKAKC